MPRDLSRRAVQVPNRASGLPQRQPHDMVADMSEAPAPSSRPVPQRVGRYEVLLPIASGGMATVYLARSQGARGFARDVALKLTHAHLTDETPDFAAILLEEARIASRIKHRNVVSIIDVGEDPLGLFLVMEYVEGDTLAGLQRGAAARSEPVPPRIGVRILLDALAGLHAAHELRDEHGQPMAVVHRDFSPQNILVGMDGMAQLADFGIAKAADCTGETATGVVKGKVVYMSPEHARSLPIDRRADVWSAGVVAWEIFAGHRLHSSKDGLATLLKVVSEKPPLLGTIVKGIGPEVEEVVARALQLDVDQRCPTAAVFARDLASAFGTMGRLAEHDEVAEYLRHMAGPKLEKRRKQVRDALKLRASMAALAEASVADASQRTPHHTDVQAPEPVTAKSDASEPVEGTPSDADSVAGEPPPPLPSTPSVLSLPSAATETSSASDMRRSLLPKGAGGPARWWVGGAVGLAVATGIAVHVLGSSGQTTASMPAMSAGAPSIPAPGESVPLVPSPQPSVDVSPVAAPSKILLHANARIGSVRVNTRSVAVAPPAAEVSFDRLPQDGDGALTVVATAVDGRKRTATLTPGAASLEIDFPALPQPRSPARPPSKTGPRKDGEIPPNPFAPPAVPPNPFGPP
jgi:serine/threonine protein kinase